MPIVPKYPLPPFLEGLCSGPKYRKWLTCKADQLQKRDKRLKRPCAKNHSQADYKLRIHDAVMENRGFDPYTGETLRWDLIGKWSSNKVMAAAAPRARSAAGPCRAMKKDFFLLPTIDHIDPEGMALDFEIVSWIVNEGKSQMTPREYRELCSKVVARGGRAAT